MQILIGIVIGLIILMILGPIAGWIVLTLTAVGITLFAAALLTIGGLIAIGCALCLLGWAIWYMRNPEAALAAWKEEEARQARS